MKKKILLLIAISIALITINLIPNFWEKPYYSYLRFKNGNTVKFDRECFTVPTGWVVLSSEMHDKKHIYDLGAKQSDLYYSLSVMKTDNSSNPHAIDPNLIKLKQDRFTVFELANPPKDVSLKYWSFIPEYGLIIMGDSIDPIRDLSASIKKTSC